MVKKKKGSTVKVTRRELTPIDHYQSLGLSDKIAWALSMTIEISNRAATVNWEYVMHIVEYKVWQILTDMSTKRNKPE